MVTPTDEPTTRKQVSSDQLDALTALELGKALFNFLAGNGEQPEGDQFRFEDTGIQIDSGFIEIPQRAKFAVLELLDDGN